MDTLQVEYRKVNINIKKNRKTRKAGRYHQAIVNTETKQNYYETENIGYKNEISFCLRSPYRSSRKQSGLSPRYSRNVYKPRVGFDIQRIIELFNKGKAMDYTLVEHEMRALDNELYAEMNGLNYVADGLLFP